MKELNQQTEIQKPSRVEHLRGKVAAHLMAASMVGKPDPEQVQAILDEEARSKPVMRGFDPTTGIEVVTNGDGSRHVVDAVSRDDLRRHATPGSQLDHERLILAAPLPIDRPQEQKHV
jgi:hypothetical protein